MDLLMSTDEKFELFNGQIVFVCMSQVVSDRHCHVRDAVAAVV